MGREMITYKLKIKFLFRPQNAQLHRASSASRARDHFLFSQTPLGITSRLHTVRSSCLVSKENPPPFLYVMRATWGCAILGSAGLAAPAPSSQAQRIGTQGNKWLSCGLHHSPAGRHGLFPGGALGQEKVGLQCPSPRFCSHHCPRGAQNECTHLI